MAQQQQDNSSDFVVGIVAAMLGLFALGYFFGEKISWFAFHMRNGEIFILKMMGIPWIFESGWNDRMGPVMVALDKGYKLMTLSDHRLAAAQTMFYFRWLLIGGMGWVGWRIASKNPAQKFKRGLNMQTLVDSEKRLWPAIAPVAKLNLVRVSASEGKWAMSKKPLEFARLYKLLDEKKQLDRERAEKLFSAQLGRLWNGAERLPKASKALFAVFAAQANGDIIGARACLDKLSMSYAAGAPNYETPELMDCLKKYGKTPITMAVVKKHAYVYTVMASMLEAAREYGVLNTAKFIWLKPVNRPLFYILNCVGRKVAFAEVAGIFAHWVAERTAGHAIERPYVTKAVDGLERALDEVIID